jgi:signal transduction histidine kinase
VGSAAVIIAVAQWTDPGSPVELALLLPAFLGFVLWGAIPRLPAELFAALVVVPVTVVVGHDGDLEGAFFLVVNVMLYSAWHLGSLTRSLVVLGACATAPWLVAEVLVPGSGIGWTAWTTASVFTFAMGRVLYRQRALIEQLEVAREALADQAVAEERRRIARELHDLAGHTLAAVLLHVTGARHVLRRDLGEAERALGDAETVGRASLDQIRATVAALRTDERGTDPALAGSADLAALVDEYRRAGLSLSAEIAPGVADLDGPTGTALHRIAREALANVAHHAPANAVDVTVVRTPDEVLLDIVDRGTRPDPAAAGSGHFGIVGMRERARALGGELAAGPTRDGWRVEAHLPVASARSEARP